MKRGYLLLLLMGVLCSLSAQAQQTSDKTEQEEVYFRFTAKPHDLRALSPDISIDKVIGDTAWAYATDKNYRAFQSKGFKTIRLPHPGDGPGVVMRDKINRVKGSLTTWNFYPTYEAYETLMEGFAADYPDLCQLITIGVLPSGRKLLALKISDNVTADEAEPEFLYTSSMHGDETTGYVLMLHLIEYLLEGYASDPEVMDLVNGMEIFINPLANPDGTYRAGNNTVSGARRGNANGVDLNRNYPNFIDGLHPDGQVWQAETLAFMDFAAAHNFVVSANFHGGIEVVNYPWDTWAPLHADDAWWQLVCRQYADTAHAHSPNGYMDDLNNGITNGYAWYEANGTRQDYMNYEHYCREITIELSNTKLLPASQLEAHWTYNYRSFLNLMKQATLGIQGTITGLDNSLPLETSVTLIGHDQYHSEVKSSPLGDYYRPVKAGTYTLSISAPCYQTMVIPNVIIADGQALVINVQLEPGLEVITAPVTEISSATAVSGGNLSCVTDGISAKGICWSTQPQPDLTDSHTNEGPGDASFVSQLNELSPATTYYIRAYAIASDQTTYGNELSFTTLCGTVSTFPWTEDFEHSGNAPACFSQEYVGTSTLNWQYLKGNGSNHPATAHSGSYNACLKDANAASTKTLLITPPLNTNLLSEPVLKFWHTQQYWSGDQDELRIFYKIGISNPWTLLAEYTGNIDSWTLEQISLPESSETLFIGFEGNACYGYGVCIDDIEVIGSPLHTLNLSVLLEGLFNGSGLNKASNGAGSAFAGDTADMVSIEFRESIAPFNIHGDVILTSLSVAGEITIPLPPGLNGSYYIVVKHRNSMETWSSVPLNVRGANISYDFTTQASSAFGNNLKPLSGKYVIYGGDVTQDGVVDSGDMSPVDNDAAAFQIGYLPTDVNGNGVVDTDDFSLIDNNSALFISVLKP